jgi:hypothetical protein
MTRAYRLAFAASLALAASPLRAQAASPIPAATPSAAATALPDSPIDLFYLARNGAPIWLKDDAGRAAAQALASILRNAAIDGVAEGPELAARVETAIAANDD